MHGYGKPMTKEPIMKADDSRMVVIEMDHRINGVAELAKKVGYEPKDTDGMRYVLTGSDNKCYDMWELLGAMFDKISEMSNDT